MAPLPHMPATVGDVQEAVERFGRLVVVELSKIRVDATTAEIARAVDNAVRRFKFEEPPS